jgi:hypothetical protein
MSAMMLGAACLGGAYFFVRAALARHWHRIGLRFLPVTTFATCLAFATLPLSMLFRARVSSLGGLQTGGRDVR